MFLNPSTQTTWMQGNHPPLLEMANQLRDVGCDCVPTPERPSLIWIMANRRNIDVIALQWPEQSYWLLRNLRSRRCYPQVIRPGLLGHPVGITVMEKGEATSRP